MAPTPTTRTPADAYLRTRVLSATPEELRLMLLDGAIRFAGQAQRGIERGDHEAAFAGFTQCRDIVTELIRSVGPGADPELAERVVGVLTFIFRELVAASAERDAERVARVIDLLAFERETWSLVVERLRAERAGAAPSDAGGPVEAADAPGAGSRRPVSLSA